MSNLLTNNPIALNALMSETLFSVDFTAEQEASNSFQQAEAQQFSTPPAGITPVIVPEEFIYQGSVEKQILFILRYPDYDYFSPGAQDAFERILSAVDLRMEDVAVVNLANAHNPNDFKRIMQFFQPTRITLLGVEPSSLVLPPIPHNAYMKGRVATVFNTYSFEEMFTNVEKKKSFWLEFKKFITND
ncbi:hypothetical protein M8998_09360 [Sphingobacterium sp. lm-10]|uniref:hypothetical protein n=1 Tax=Sphingobacterium sp. lm-10 TaxID=2944904 RepID=UPI00201FB409|nr:hypothetical protein [Sphingobacterium sp. lm-10]MCL7988142.1 hypothetical protein [Sphingobacterium sp. lm-10]